MAQFTVFRVIYECLTPRRNYQYVQLLGNTARSSCENLGKVCGRSLTLHGVKHIGPFAKGEDSLNAIPRCQDRQRDSRMG